MNDRRKLFLGGAFGVAAALLALTIMARSEARRSARPYRITALPLAERDYVRQYASLRDVKNYYEVRCAIANTSRQTQTFNVSGKAEWLGWQTNDRRIVVPPLFAMSISIKHVTLPPGKRYEIVLPLVMRDVQAGQTLRYRMGFRMGPAKVLWSDPISIQARRE